MQIKSVYRALAVALAVAGLCTAAQAQSAPSVVSVQFKDWLAAQPRGMAQSPQAMAVVVDTTPPQLIRFNAIESVDVGVLGAVMQASFKASDDLAGVTSVSALATGPSGQRVQVLFGQAVPSKQLAGTMNSWGSFGPNMEPGTYTFIQGWVFDAAGNYQFVDEAALAALGKVTFEVKNQGGYDKLPPSLVSGTIVTPKVSLVATHPGTSQPKYVQLAIETIDAGNTAVSGLWTAMADFCLPDQSKCLFFSADPNDRHPMSAKASLKLATQIFDKSTPLGEYHIRSISLTDSAGNFQYLKSAEFGGSTDFGTYFPSTTIKLVP